MLRSFVKIPKHDNLVEVAIKNIGGEDWFCTDKKGRGILMTTEDGASPTPPDHLMLALGTCFGAGVKKLLIQNKKKVKLT